MSLRGPAVLALAAAALSVSAVAGNCRGSLHGQEDRDRDLTAGTWTFFSQSGRMKTFVVTV
jgi:hypothetical protein